MHYTKRMEQKKWDEAAAALRASMERNPSSEAAVKLHGVLLVAGNRAEADKLEATWLTRWPGDAIFLFHLGDIAMSRQEWAIAEQHYRKVIDLQPRYALAHNNVAWLLIEQKKPGALPFAQKGNELLPNTPRVMDTLAAALSADGQVAKALELQKMALAMDPSSPLLSLGLARIAIKAGDKALAKTELEKLAYLGDKFPAQAEVNQLLRTLQ